MIGWFLVLLRLHAFAQARACQSWLGHSCMHARITVSPTVLQTGELEPGYKRYDEVTLTGATTNPPDPAALKSHFTANERCAAKIFLKLRQEVDLYGAADPNVKFALAVYEGPLRNHVQICC